MLLDNENQNKKVHEWITEYTAQGKMSIVTGYFTIGALAFLARHTQDKVNSYRFVLGDIVNFDANRERSLDLLNENISIDAALKLGQLAREAVAFLSLEKVKAKTLEPNFCHAKAYIFKTFSPKVDPQKDYYITGSSNLTEAGIGLKKNNNIELNIANFGADAQFREITEWFETLWKSPQAHANKTVKLENGKTRQVNFKEYLIGEIQKIFVEYTPKELYYKVLFELFGSDMLLEANNPELNRDLGRLENTMIYNSLYEYQRKGVISLIKMLQKYNGAILADAVGLGKTWSALAVMRFYQMKGREVILLCPKKLQNNWRNYQKNQNSRFEKDQFEYFLRFHTDLSGDLLDRYADRSDKRFVSEKPKLFVIDESHNLRNDKSSRYQFLLDEILSKNEDAKVLLLSATPINNSLNDIRNQFKLIVKGNAAGFSESLDIKNIDYIFRTAQKSFNEWSKIPAAHISDFIKKLPPNYFRLTDALTVARTRKMIAGHQDGLTFPLKAKPQNIFVTPKEIGNFDSFEELFDHFPPMLSGYQPAFYTESKEERKKRNEAKKKGLKSEIPILEDELQRDRFLVKMMYILMVKRLESSWSSFQITIERILAHHQNALDKIKRYEQTKKDELADERERQLSLFEDDDSQPTAEEITLGKKRPIKLSDIDRAGNLTLYKKDLKKDLDALQLLQSNLTRFKEKVTLETHYQSQDLKLEKLIECINEKRKRKTNAANSKVLIFTVYKDTAFYLLDQLTKRGFGQVAAVSGDATRIGNDPAELRDFEPILERFAPFTKLFKEKQWKFEPTQDAKPLAAFAEWKQWVEKNEPKTHAKLQAPIDILIATDALSEGQNLQDCDLVINYDIHWNPVRVIQRMGRIDRLGSPNEVIFGVNFWPSDNINSYLNLQGRIEQRMAAMQLAGAEVHHEFSDTFREMAADEELEQRQKDRMLEQMQSSWDEIDTERSLGFDDFSLEIYRQELLEELRNRQKYYEGLPNAIYTGFVGQPVICPQQGIVALLGYPARPPKVNKHIYKNHELIYINYRGESVLLNQKEVLESLAKHKNEARDNEGLRDIDLGKPEAIQQLSTALTQWLKRQTTSEEVNEDGTTTQRMGKAQFNLFDQLKSGNKAAIHQLKTEGGVEEKYQKDNFDLIVWFVVNAP